jgi:hypothetical protein
MIIEEKDFRLIPINECSDKFNLELLYIVNKGKSNEKQEYKNAAYGIRLDSAIRKIANFRINNKCPDIIDLRTYLKEYRIILADITKLCAE